MIFLLCHASKHSQFSSFQFRCAWIFQHLANITLIYWSLGYISFESLWHLCSCCILIHWVGGVCSLWLEFFTCPNIKWGCVVYFGRGVLWGVCAVRGLISDYDSGVVRVWWNWYDCVVRVVRMDRVLLVVVSGCVLWWAVKDLAVVVMCLLFGVGLFTSVV